MSNRSLHFIALFNIAVHRNYAHLMGNEEWVDDLHSADVIFVAAHSQGTVVSVHLIDKLIKDGHIMTDRNVETIAQAVSQVAPAGTTLPSTTHTQKICCLALCGVHLGPLRYLRTSSLLQPYIQVSVSCRNGPFSQGIETIPTPVFRKCGR